MYPLSYVRPASLQEALDWLAREPEARPLAGGMTLIPTLKQRLAAPSHLVDLSRLQELRGVSADNGLLRVGAATRHAEVAASAVVRGAIPGLASLAEVIADPQVRNRGTMGGSVANNDPAADYPAAVLGLGATVLTDRRRIAADEFFAGMFETALEPGEVIVGFEFPIPRRSAYAKYRHKATGYAVAGVFIAETAAGPRVAVTGAGPCVFRWQEAEQALAAGGIAAVEEAGLDESTLNEDRAGGAAYRANLVRVLTRRAWAALQGPGGAAE
ncbi:MAG: xanthine dehydrogenase family protein subunit M [Pigmentiphaga sp.]|uniref:FAD binding domain-containing protein n=1 Tax=Pigmentiphaga sp. TaxID=1977564 RepID=UPI0029A244FD|nr:xanthine dehydrogenase family protein subunit M [Pigmentiphaga sp.]MDX3905215.1 xanthine dehydrogenase family protein subunit M [Pigmentiphaga sp.]